MGQNNTNPNECNLLLQHEILSKGHMRTVLTSCTKRLRGALRTNKEQNITSRMISILLGGVKNMLHKIKRRKAKRTLHILRRNCLLKQAIEGEIKGKGRGRRRGKQLLNELKETGRYFTLQAEALDCTLWRTRFGSGYAPVVRQTM